MQTSLTCLAQSFRVAYANVASDVLSSKSRVVSKIDQEAPIVEPYAK